MAVNVEDVAELLDGNPESSDAGGGVTESDVAGLLGGPESGLGPDRGSDTAWEPGSAGEWDEANLRRPPAWARRALGDTGPVRFEPTLGPSLSLDYSTPAQRREQAWTEGSARIADAYGKGAGEGLEARADNIRVARALRLPLSVVQYRRDDFRGTMEAQGFDVEAWSRRYPHLRELALNTGLGELVTRDVPLGLLEEALNKAVDFREWLDPLLESARPVEEQGPTAARLRRETQEAGRVRPLAAPFLRDIRSETAGTGLGRAAKLFYARYMESGRGVDISLAYGELREAATRNLLHPGSADEDDIREKILELERTAAPLDLGAPTRADATLGTIAQAFASQIAVFEQAGPVAAAITAAGVVIGALAGSPGGPPGIAAGAKTGAGAGLSLGMRAGVFLGSAAIEGGDSYREMLQVRTSDGELLGPAITIGASHLVGILSGGVEALQFGLLLRAAGIGASVKTLAGRDVTFRTILGRVGKAYVAAIAGEGTEEALQYEIHAAGQYLATALQQGQLPAEFPGSARELAQATEAGLIGGGALGGMASAIHLGNQLRGLAAARAGHGQALALSALAGSQTTRAMPDVVAGMVVDATAKTGRPVPNLFVTAAEFVRYYQEQGLDPHDAAKEMLGQDGPEQLNAAVLVDGKLEVPMERYLERWAGGEAAAALAPHTTTQASHPTAAELETWDKEIEATAGALAELYMKENPEATTPAERDYVAQVDALIAAAPQLYDKQSARRALAPLWAMMRTQAAVFDMDQAELFRDYRLAVVRAGAAATGEAPEVTFAFGANVAEPTAIIAARAKVAAMTTNRAAGKAWLEYVTGRTDKRPAVTNKMERMFANEFGLVDPVHGFQFGEAGEELARPMAGRRTKGIEPEEFRKARILKAMTTEEAMATGHRVFYQPAWHGTPHEFEKFSLQAMGTGEGSRAFGWGLYFAGKAEIAEYYRKEALRGAGVEIHVGDRILNPNNNLVARQIQYEMARGEGSTADVLPVVRGTFRREISFLEKRLAEEKPGTPEYADEEGRLVRAQLDLATAEKLTPDDVRIRKGQVFQVDVPEDSELLDYDKPLSEQSAAMRAAVGIVMGNAGLEPVAAGVTGREIYHALMLHFATGAGAVAGDERASGALSAAGIPGLRYLAGVSRAAGEGAHNYVIWDENRIDIRSRLYQAMPGDFRGYTDFARVGLLRIARIALTKNADLSTYLHESAHVFLDLMGELAARPNAPDRIGNDYATAMAWLGVTKQSDITEAQHEKFARGFEAYLMTGKAPSAKLVGAFETFRLWLVDIYRNLVALVAPGELSDDIRGVFDRLLATDEEIARRKKAMGIDKPLLTADDFPTTPKYQSYLAEQVEASAHTIRQADFAAMKDRHRAQEAWWRAEEKKLRDAAEVEYERLPARLASLGLRGQVFNDGKPIKMAAPFTFAKSAVVAAVGEAGAKKFTTAPAGTMPDEVAPFYGYPTGARMLEAVAGLEPKAEWIKRTATERMAARHPDVLRDRTELRKEVDKGLHGDFTLKWLLHEYAVLANKGHVSPGRYLDSAVRRAAELVVAGMRVGSLDAGAVLRRERTAADGATKAAARGDFAQAAVFKRKQILNMHIHRQLSQAIEERDIFERFAKKLAKDKARARIGKTSPALLDGIDSVLDVLGFRGSRGPAAHASLGKTALAIEAHAGTVMFDPVALALVLERVKQLTPTARNGNPIPAWRGMTFAELRLVSAALKNINAVATVASTVILGEAKAEKEFVVGELLRSAQANMPLLELLPEKPFQSWTQKVIGGLASLDGSLLNIDVMIEMLGGLNNLDSPWVQAISRPLSDAKAREADLLRGPIKRIISVLDAIPRAIRSRSMERIDGAALFPGHAVKSGQPIRVPEFRAQLLSIALNAGNESSRYRLLNGRNITEEQLKRALELLTKEELDWVQSVWDAMEELKEPAFALEQRMNGLRPESIEAVPLVTRHGTYRGGYYPAIYDRSVEAAGERQAASTLAGLMDPWFIRPGTPHGYVLSRVEGFSGALSLDPNIIVQHLAQVAHDIAFREAIRSVGSLVLDSRVQAEMKNRLGDARTGQVLRWLRDVGHMRGIDGGEHVGALMSVMRKVRGNTVIAALGYSVPNAIEDLSNFVSVIPATGLRPIHLAAGLAEFARGPFRAIAAVEAESGEMRSRADHIRRELAQRLAGPTARGPLSTGPLRWFKDHAFFLLDASERGTATPIWIGAKRQALAAGKTDSGAVRFADSVVGQIYAAYSPVDQSAILRDRGFVGTSLIFYSFLNKSFNVLRRLVHPLHVARSWDEKARLLAPVGGRVLGYLIAYGVVSEFLRGRGPEKDETWESWFLRKLAVAPVLSMPYGGDAGNLVEGFVLGRHTNPRNLSIFGAGAGVVAAALSAGSLILDGPDDDEKMRQLVRELVRAQGPMLGLPLAQPDRALGYALAVWSGGVEARDPFDVASGLGYGERAEGRQPLNPLRFMSEAVSGPHGEP